MWCEVKWNDNVKEWCEMMWNDNEEIMVCNNNE